jgi:hypothetical protein
MVAEFDLTLANLLYNLHVRSVRYVAPLGR